MLNCLRFTYFRALLSAAPLKLYLMRPVMVAHINFRALLSAAPLKRSRISRPDGIRQQFPRSLERGSIEASIIETVVAVPTEISALS